MLISSVKKVSHRHINNVDKLHKSYNTLYFDFVLVKRQAILKRMKLFIWGGVTVVLIAGVAEAMPDSWSEAIDFVHAACLSLVALGPSFVLKKQVAVWGFQHFLFVGVGDIQAEFEEQWSGMGGPCMMAYIEIGLDVGYEWGLWM